MPQQPISHNKDKVKKKGGELTKAKSASGPSTLATNFARASRTDSTV